MYQQKDCKFMHLPQGPQTPALWQMLRWITSPLSFMEECTQRYGDIFTIKLQTKSPPIVVVSNPQVLQEILTSDTQELTAPGEINQAFSLLLGKNSLITISGKEHQRQRQLIMPSFHGERMRNYSQLINNVTEEVITQNLSNKPFDTRSLTQTITLRVIMQAVFGIYDNQRAQKLERLLKEILDQGSSLLSTILLHFPILQGGIGALNLWGKQIQRQEEIDRIIYQEIQERREKFDSSRTDILSLLMSAKDETGQGMTDVELRDELITLLAAGHETTSTALAWALYWIHKYPRIREKLLQELDSLGNNPDSGIILKSPYLHAVYCETLRIYPVGMLTFPRVVKTPISLGGYQLEPGTVILGSIYLTHQREDIYPQAKEFKPERFLERQFSPYEYLPFGGGVRRCIGLAFAQLEMKLALFEILTNWELELCDYREVKPTRRGLLTGPDQPILMLIKSPRQQSSRPLLSITN